MADWIKALAEIPDDPEVDIDLTSPQYGFSSKNQIQLEKKDDMKRRGLASPDIGDTLAMSFAVNIASRHFRKPAKVDFDDFVMDGLRWMR